MDVRIADKTCTFKWPLCQTANILHLVLSQSIVVLVTRQEWFMLTLIFAMRVQSGHLALFKFRLQVASRTILYERYLQNHNWLETLWSFYWLVNTERENLKRLTLVITCYVAHGNGEPCKSLISSPMIRYVFVYMCVAQVFQKTWGFVY